MCVVRVGECSWVDNVKSKFCNKQLEDIKIICYRELLDILKRYVGEFFFIIDILEIYSKVIKFYNSYKTYNMYFTYYETFKRTH